MDQNIQQFLEDNKVSEVLEAEDPQTALTDWLTHLGQFAKELTRTTHPTKFSHSGIKNTEASLLLVDAKQRNDGFVRSGNVVVPWDMQGNSARLKVFKFLALTLQDGDTVFAHFQSNSSVLQKILAMNDSDYQALRQAFLAVEPVDKPAITNGRLKQVYFPVKADYHLLSLLTPSGILQVLSDRIKERRFSEAAQAARNARKTNQPHPQGLQEFYDLTLMGYGGTKPQNVSGLNMLMGGRIFLLPSLPPPVKAGYVRIPRKDFFQNALYVKRFEFEFGLLAKTMQRTQNNLEVRNRRDKIIENLWLRMLHTSWSLRRLTPGWSRAESCQLPQAQKIWLDAEAWSEEREQESWQEEIINDFLRWLKYNFNAYMDRSHQDFRLADADIRYYKHDLLLPHQEELL